MSQRGLWHAVSAWFRTDHSSRKIHGEVKGFVPSDRVVRYLRQVERRRWNGGRMKARPTAS